jgi:hypothetical protein
LSNDDDPLVASGGAPNAVLGRNDSLHLAQFFCIENIPGCYLPG